jgi:predicted RNase H-like HicB family nuclease
MNPKYVYWQSGKWWIGYLAEYPDYHTQGESHQDLIDHLLDLYHDFTNGLVPGVRRVGELVVA